jgi:hypothetical protein
VNGAVSIRDGPLEIVAEAPADVSHEVLPAGEAVFPRERQLGVAVRQGSFARELLGLFTKGVERGARRERS